MANRCVESRRRTKCGRVGYEVWIWCILCLVINVTCIRTRSVSDENTVSMYPEGDSYVLYGTSLEIFCKTNGKYTSRDLEFTLGSSHLQSEVVNDTTIRLFIERPKEHPRRTYYCKNKASNRNALKSVYVASPPAEVQDFKCISKNLDSLNCSWTTPDLVIFTNYNLTSYYYALYGYPTTPCVANVIDKSLTRYCYWNASSQPRYRQQEKYYYFVLEGTNPLGTMKQNFTIDHFSVVKPDPPIGLQNVSESPHSVVLNWSIPHNMVDFLPGGVEHKIEYQIAKIDQTSHFRSVNTSGLPTKNKTYKFILTDLPYAHMQYGVRVYIKPVKAESDEFWSDYSFKLFDTASESPRRPPDTAAGAFAQSAYDTGRVINVYWKQLEEYEEAGANFTYRVQVEGSNGIQRWLYPDKSKSLGFLYLDGASLDAMQVTIRSENEKGLSVNSSHLYIPSERDTRSLSLSSFSKLAYENGTYELSWIGINGIDNYTLFWCQHNTTDICTGRINFMTLDSKKNKHIIDLPRDYRFQFAISANNGTKTSGMVWAKCDISKEAIAMYRFPVRFTDHDAPGKSFVKIRWSIDCALKEGIITGYNITYCPVIGTSSYCDDKIGNKSSYINNSKQMDINVTDLLPYKTYQFSMALSTIYGLKTIENATVRITTLEDTPTSPRNVTISNVTSNSLVVSWYPPEHENGHKSQIKYVIHNLTKKMLEIKYEDLSKEFKKQVLLDNLNGFTNYSLTVQACNDGINSCSEPTNPIFVRTRIGRPSKLSQIPVFERYPSNRLTWIKPDFPGGPLDRYQIKVVKNYKTEEIFNTTDLFFTIDDSCGDGVEYETYQVRAINFDEDGNHGAAATTDSVSLPIRDQNDTSMIEFLGQWSDVYPGKCTSRNNFFLFFIIIGVLAVIGLGCGLLKVYKKLRKMGDIKPAFPNGLFVPEKDLTKYPFGGLYPQEKDEKPTSDESLLLPNSKTKAPSPETKQTESDNCGSSDHTESTALSDTSQGPMDRKNSDSANSSLHLEPDPVKVDDASTIQFEDSSNSDTESSCENSPYFSDAFKKNASGYVQQPVVSPSTGYVQSSAALKNPLPKPVIQPASSGYVMAGLPPLMFTPTVASIPATQPPPPSGYMRPEDVQSKLDMNFPKLGPSPINVFRTESLPPMSILPPLKHPDSSYIQLQSLDAMPSHKPSNIVPSKVPTSSGYVSPGDAMISKHLQNMLSTGQPVEESAILDPAMSPDAYCRFSWSADPTNDNLHFLHANSPRSPSKN